MRYLFVGSEGIEELSARIAASPLAGRLVLEDHEDEVVVGLRGASLAEAQALVAQSGAVLRDEAQLLDQISRGEELFAMRAALLGLGALWHSDLRLLALLRRLSLHPRSEVRAGVVALGSRVGYRLFLLEILARETDPVLRRILLSVTAFPEPEPAEVVPAVATASEEKGDAQP